MAYRRGALFYPCSPPSATTDQGVGHGILMQAMDSPIRFRLIILAEPIPDTGLGDDYERLRTRLDRFIFKRKVVWDDGEEPAA